MIRSLPLPVLYRLLHAESVKFNSLGQSAKRVAPLNRDIYLIRLAIGVTDPRAMPVATACPASQTG